MVIISTLFHFTQNTSYYRCILSQNQHIKFPAVLKYMAKEGCERQEAQGNMDAFFESPNGTNTHSNMASKTIS